MTKPFSLEYKRKMLSRLTGKNAVTATALAAETGISQGSLSNWLREARTLPEMIPPKPKGKQWSLNEKIRLLAEANKLTGEQLFALLEREGLPFAELERWRRALVEEGEGSAATSRLVKKLERELARKEKALAEAAALLVLKKKLENLSEDEDDDTDEENEI